MYYIIYEIKNLINDKIYVGFHKTSKIDDGYMGSGKYIKRAINKYGIDNFSKKIIKLCSTEKEMIDLEKEIVNEDFLLGNVYNLKLGGSGGFRKGFIATQDKKYISYEEFICGNHNGVNKNKIPVIDSIGNKFITFVDNEKIKTKEYVPCFHKNGTVNVFNKFNKMIKITKEEYNLNKSEYVSIYKNKTTVKDKDGNSFVVSTNDERFLSGELVGITRGQSFQESEYIIYDNNGIEKIHITNENFTDYLKNNNLPSVFWKSQLEGGIPIYQKIGSNRKRLEEKDLLKYKGWYCKRIK